MMASTSFQENIYQNIYGKWKFYKAIDINEVAPFPRDDPEEFDTYIKSPAYKDFLKAADVLANYVVNKTIVLKKNYVIINGIKYCDPIYSINEEYPDTYCYALHRVGDPSDLGIKEDGDKVQVFRLFCRDSQSENEKNLSKVTTERLKIPCPDCSATFYIDDFIIYNGELIMSFLIKMDEENPEYPSWQKYLCLKKVK